MSKKRDTIASLKARIEELEKRLADAESAVREVHHHHYRERPAPRIEPTPWRQVPATFPYTTWVGGALLGQTAGWTSQTVHGNGARSTAHRVTIN